MTLQSLSPVLARYDPFGVDVPLNFDNTHPFTHSAGYGVPPGLADVVMPNRSAHIARLSKMDVLGAKVMIS